MRYAPIPEASALGWTQGGDRGNTEIIFRKGESTGRRSTHVDTGTMRLASDQPRRNEARRRPGEANPFAGARRPNGNGCHTHRRLTRLASVNLTVNCFSTIRNAGTNLKREMAASGLSLKADIARYSQHVSKVPGADQAPSQLLQLHVTNVISQEKPAARISAAKSALGAVKSVPDVATLILGN